jgi:hypothetical protein
VKLRERLTPYLLLGVLALGTGLGFGSTGASGVTANTLARRLHAYEVAIVRPHELIVANHKGIYKVTADQWTNITPPLINSQPVLLSHIFKIVTYGDERIWLEMEGDFRFDFIPYSSDGGVTWQTADLPDGANNPTSLRFTSPNDGRVIAYASTSSTNQNDNEKLSLQTVDGGASWTLTTERPVPTSMIGA